MHWYRTDTLCIRILKRRYRSVSNRSPLQSTFGSERSIKTRVHLTLLLNGSSYQYTSRFLSPPCITQWSLQLFSIAFIQMKNAWVGVAKKFRASWLLFASLPLRLRLSSFTLLEKKRVLLLWLVIAAPSHFLNFRRGDLDRVRMGKRGVGKAVYLFRSRFVCLMKISSKHVHLKIVIAATETRSCKLRWYLILYQAVLYLVT